MIRSSSITRILALSCGLIASGFPSALGSELPFFPMYFGFQKAQTQGMQSNLVRVRITTRYSGAKEPVEINGELVQDKSPVIIRAFSSTGIVLEQHGHIMTFLGHDWLHVKNDAVIEVFKDGQKWKGKLVGVDQTNGVAVIKLLGAKLKKTPTCDNCTVKDGSTVITPVSSGTSRFRQAQVVSIEEEPEVLESGGWSITVDRPFPDIGQPIMTPDHRVLGFIASQDPMGIRNIVYPISQLLASAEKIIKKGGDIYAGWLGLFLLDANPAMGPGVLVQSVEPDSPAQQAGILAGDHLIKYNGQQLNDSLQLIQLVEGSAIGSKADVELVRRGNPLSIKASVAERRIQPVPERLAFDIPGLFGFQPGIFSQPASRNQKLLIGVDTILLNPSLAEVLKAPVQNGVLVIDVMEDSPARLSGIVVGDVITAIDGQPIQDAPTFAEFLQTHSWGPQVLLQINRKGVEHLFPVQLAGQAITHKKDPQ